MEAKELRIGNYVSHNGFAPTTIDAVDIIHCQQHPEAYKPIELTEEWFERFNLNHDGRLHSANEEIKNESAKDVGVIYVSYFFNERLGKWMDCQTRIVFNYVHQVQNHYYVMTGEELTIKS